MGRRILAFFLGMIFGIVLFFGAVAGVLYFAATNVTPGDIYPDSDKFLGDLANMSILDIYNSLSELYLSKIGVRGENGLYYTLGEFLDNYNIDPKEAFGAELDQDVLDIPIFEYFGGDMDAALDQTKVSAMFHIVNLFASTTDEDGNTNAFFSDVAIGKVRDFSMADLLSADKGVPVVFENLLLCDVFTNMFPSERTNDNAMRWAFGQTSIGKLSNGINEKFLLEFRQDGVFDTIGSLQMAELFGSSSAIMNVLFGNATFGELIDANGNLNPDKLMGGLFLGSLLGLQRNEIDDLEGYEALHSNENRSVMQKNNNGESLYVIVVDDVAYEAKFYCNEEDHVHDASCFIYVWYSTTASDDYKDTDLIKDELHYPLATGIYGAIADITVSDLMSGESNALIDKLMDIQLKELLDGQEVSGLLESIGDMTLRELVNEGIDNVYLGTVFSNERKPITTDVSNYLPVTNRDGETIDGVLQDAHGALIKEEDGTWYEGKVTCGTEEHKHGELCDPLKNYDYVCELTDHKHDETCYGFVWYVNSNYDAPRTGAQGFLCNFKLGEINSINKLVQSMTLGDVLSDIPAMLEDLRDTRIGDFDTAIQEMYLGSFLEYSRKRVEPKAEMPTIVYAANGNGTPNTLEFAYYLYENGNSVILSTNGRDFYEGKLLCEDEHEHTGDCYVFVWCNAEGEVVEGMMGKLANEKICNLDKLFDKIQTFTLKDVLGDNVPSMLKSIENTKIGQLGAAIENMYLGDFLSNTRKPTTGSLGDSEKLGNLYVIDKDGVIALSDDGKTFYEGKLVCEQDHLTHEEACYSYVWYQLNCNNDSHDHTDDCYTLTNGLMGRMAGMRISEMSAESITDLVHNTPLRDVMDLDENSNGLLKELGDTKIGELSSELDALYVGIAMGYHRNEIQDVDVTNLEKLAEDTNPDHYQGTAIYKDEASNLYFFDAKHKKYFEAQQTCVDNGHDGNANQHEFNCFGFVWYNCNHFDEEEIVHDKNTVVKGLNGKMSDMRIDELSGSNMTRIAQSLTLGDLIDSGMMSLGDSDSETENVYKFAIICCKNDNHSISEFNPLGDGYKCSLQDYYSYQVAQMSSISAKDYWLKTHGFTSEEELTEADVAHRDEWRNQSLTNFISTLLNAM